MIGVVAGSCGLWLGGAVNIALCCYGLRGQSEMQAKVYCEKTLSPTVVLLVVIVRVVSMVSISPAARVVVSSCQGWVLSVTEKVVEAPAMSALGVTLVPLQVFMAEP